MTVSLARLMPGPAHAGEDRRRERRHAPRYAAACRATLETMRGSMSVLLADVSPHGCSIRGEAEWLRPGTFASIRLEDTPRLEAIVRWVRGDAAGMEFLRPIPADRMDWRDLMDFGFEA